MEEYARTADQVLANLGTARPEGQYARYQRQVNAGLTSTMAVAPCPDAIAEDVALAWPTG